MVQKQSGTTSKRMELITSYRQKSIIRTRGHVTGIDTRNAIWSSVSFRRSNGFGELQHATISWINRLFVLCSWLLWSFC